MVQVKIKTSLSTEKDLSQTMLLLLLHLLSKIYFSLKVQVSSHRLNLKKF